MKRTQMAACAWTALAAMSPAEAKPALSRVGQCLNTTITLIGPRLENAPDSGTTVGYATGFLGVSYELESAILRRSRVGDPVRLCLASIPTHCPKGDDRGKFYRAVNLRTKAHWNLPDSEHLCGGA